MTPDETLAIAQQAAREQADWEYLTGHSGPRTNWDAADGTYLAGTWSHIQAAGVTSRYGIRSNAVAFRDAYLAEWRVHKPETTN